MKHSLIPWKTCAKCYQLGWAEGTQETRRQFLPKTSIELLEGEHFGTPPKTYADAAFDAYESQFTGPAGSNPALSADEQLSADISAAFTNYTFKR